MGLTRLRSLILSVSVWQGLLEGLVILAFLLTLEGTVGLTLRLEVGRFSPSALGLLVWVAIRPRLAEGPWRRWLLAESALGALLAALLVVTLTVDTFFDPFPGPRTGGNLTLPLASLSISPLVAEEAVRIVAVTVAATLGFVVLRVAWHLWRYWDGLRRTRLVWSLTHAHVVLLVLVTALIGTLFVARTARSTHDVISSLLFIVIGTGLEVVVILPASALFSYLVARRTGRRIEELAAATSALRAGDYAIRVPVVGLDEVARLQDDFNAMAATLDRAIHDLQAERDTVARLLESRQELLANVSHELRTPVATLRGYMESSQIDRDGVLPDGLRHDLRVMEHEVVRLQELLDDLFSIARADVGQLALRCEPIDIGALAARSVETIAPLAWQSGRVEVVSHLAKNVPPARVDPRRIEQVLRNLLQNAVRHTPPGGLVAVTVNGDDETVCVQVRDTGEGIPAEDLPHIWERFYRAGNSQSWSGGTGLGLALVKELTEAMNGLVSVESVLGAGSCFTLRLPRS